VPGSRMEKTDGLSRRLDWRKGVGKDNEDRTLVKAEWLRKEEAMDVMNCQIPLSEYLFLFSVSFI